MNNIKVVPDGSLIDRVAEFVYMEKDRIQELYYYDSEGYKNAIAKFVQALASGIKIVGAEHPAFTTVTNNLKEKLKNYDKLEYSEFFSQSKKESHRRVARNWLSDNWNKICSELNDPESNFYGAMIGHLKREFFYYWIKLDENWTASWYLQDEEIMKLPEKIRKRIENELGDLNKKYNCNISEEKLKYWIEQTISTHFFIFARYLLFLGPEYMPASTRDSLQFLKQSDKNSSVKEMILPYIGLRALKKVKKRSDLIESVIDWSIGEGKDVARNLYDLQVDFRKADNNQQKQEKILSNIEHLIESEQTRPFMVTISYLRIITSAFRKKIDSEAIDNLIHISTSKSYRWLWDFRDPNLNYELRIRIGNLINN